MVDECDVEDPETTGSAGGIEVFAPGLNRKNFILAERMQDIIADVLGRMLESDLQFPSAFDMFVELLRKCLTVQIAPDDCLRFVLLRNLNGGNPVLSSGNPAVLTDEIQVVCPVHHQLGQDRIVVFRGGEMAVCAAFCVLFPRTVCGTFVLQAIPASPSADTVCC